MDNPRLPTAYIATALALLSLFGLVKYYPSIADDVLVLFVLVLVVLALTAGALVTWVNWITYQAANRLEDYHRAQAVTPMLEIVNAVQRLNKDQLEMVKSQGYHAQVGVLGAKDGPTYYLATPRGNIPMNVVERELRLSSLVALAPIRNYSDGSPEREWRRMFTGWCIDHGLAIPAVGHDPARWVDKNSRAIAASMLGIGLYEAEAQDDDE